MIAEQAHMRTLVQKHSSKLLDVFAYIILNDLTEIFALSEVNDRFSGLVIRGNEVLQQEFNLGEINGRILSIKERAQLSSQCTPPPGYAWSES